VSLVIVLILPPSNPIDASLLNIRRWQDHDMAVPGPPKLTSPDAEDEEDIGAGEREALAVSAGARAAPFLSALVIPRIATKPGENVQSMVLVFEMPIEEARSFSGLSPEDAAAIAARACHGPHCHRHGTTRRELRCSFELVPILWIRLHELDLIDVFIQLVAYLLQETERPDL
jgi:hypothetical protein